MTRTDELFSMTGRTLIQLADKLGVKVACNKTRTQLKEKKDNVVERILEAEKQISDKEAEKQIEEVVEAKVEEVTENVASDETEYTPVMKEIQQDEAKAVKAVKTEKKVKAEDIEELSKYVFKCLKDLDCTIKQSTNNRYVFKIDGHTFAKFRCGRTITFQLCSDAIKDIDVNYHTINVKFNAVIKFTKYTVENKEVIQKLLVACRDYQLNKKSKNSNKEEQ